jgi:hypothetical protein
MNKTKLLMKMKMPIIYLSLLVGSIVYVFFYLSFSKEFYIDETISTIDRYEVDLNERITNTKHLLTLISFSDKVSFDNSPDYALKLKLISFNECSYRFKQDVSDILSSKKHSFYKYYLLEKEFKECYQDIS